MQTNFRAFAAVSAILPILALGQLAVAQVQDLHNDSGRFAAKPTVFEPVAKTQALDSQTPTPRPRYEVNLFANKPIVEGTDRQAVLTSTDLVAVDSTLDAIVFPRDHFTVVPRRGLANRVWTDHVNFYSPASLLLIGFSLGVGAVVANTTIDQDIQRHLQSSLRSANSNDWLEGLHANKELGDGRYTLPIYASAWALGSLLPESDFSTGTKVWGERTIRGFLVGAPPVLLLQHLTGGARPGEAASGSEWEPFRDNNGVSGHAFMGALPFITAAKMSDNVGLKATFYAASALAPLSRAADGAHYPSQVALGWSMAFVAASAVYSSDNPDSRWRILPTTTAAGSGMALEYRF